MEIKEKTTYNSNESLDKTIKELSSSAYVNKDTLHLYISVDQREFKEKPKTNKEKSSMFFNTLYATLPMVEKWCSKGYTFASLYKDNSGKMKNTFSVKEKNNRNYMGQQFVFVDIDHYHHSLDWIMERILLKPSLAYYTFSEGKNGKKNGHNMRLVYAFGSMLNAEEYAKIMEVLDYMLRISFNEKERILDGAASKRSQMFFGTRKENMYSEQSYLIYSKPDLSGIILPKEQEKELKKSLNNTHTSDINDFALYQDSLNECPGFWKSLEEAYNSGNYGEVGKWIELFDGKNGCYRVNEQLQAEEEVVTLEEDGKKFSYRKFPKGKLILNYPMVKKIERDDEGNVKIYTKVKILMDGEHRRKRLFTYGMMRRGLGCSFVNTVYNLIYDQHLFTNNDDKVFTYNEILRVSKGIFVKPNITKPKMKYMQFDMDEVKRLGIHWQKYCKEGFKAYRHAMIKEKIMNHIGDGLGSEKLFHTVRDEMQKEGVNLCRRTFFIVKKEMGLSQPYPFSKSNTERKTVTKIKTPVPQVKTVLTHTHTSDITVNAQQLADIKKSLRKAKIYKVSDERKLKIFKARRDGFKILMEKVRNRREFSHGLPSMLEDINYILECFNDAHPDLKAASMYYYCKHYLEKGQDVNNIETLEYQYNKFAKLTEQFEKIIADKKNAA